MSKKNAAAQAKARQKKIARKDAKRKAKRKDIRFAAVEAAQLSRERQGAIDDVNDLWFDAEDAEAFLGEPAEDATPADLEAAVLDMAFDLQQTLKFVTAVAGENNPAIAATLGERGFAFTPVNHLRMAEAAVELAALHDVEGARELALDMLATWASLARSDVELQTEVAASLRYLTGTAEEQTAITMERLRALGIQLPAPEPLAVEPEGVAIPHLGGEIGG